MAASAGTAAKARARPSSGAVRWAQFDTDYDMYDGNPVFWDK